MGSESDCHKFIQMLDLAISLRSEQSPYSSTRKAAVRVHRSNEILLIWASHKRQKEFQWLMMLCHTQKPEFSITNLGRFGANSATQIHPGKYYSKNITGEEPQQQAIKNIANLNDFQWQKAIKPTTYRLLMVHFLLVQEIITKMKEEGYWMLYWRHPCIILSVHEIITIDKNGRTNIECCIGDIHLSHYHIWKLCMAMGESPVSTVGDTNHLTTNYCINTMQVWRQTVIGEAKHLTTRS